MCTISLNSMNRNYSRIEMSWLGAVFVFRECSGSQSIWKDGWRSGVAGMVMELVARIGLGELGLVYSEPSQSGLI